MTSTASINHIFSSNQVKDDPYYWRQMILSERLGTDPRSTLDFDKLNNKKIYVAERAVDLPELSQEQIQQAEILQNHMVVANARDIAIRAMNEAILYQDPDAIAKANKMFSEANIAKDKPSNTKVQNTIAPVPTNFLETILTKGAKDYTNHQEQISGYNR